MPAVLKKVVIFGASGNTGLATVEAALKKGYEVTAFVRDKAKLGQVTPQNIIQGDVLNKDDVNKAVENQDGVIIALGTRNDLSPTTVMSDGTKNILEAKKGAKCEKSYAVFKEPPRGNYVIKNEAAVGRVISKYDLAEILVNCLTTEEHFGHYVGIGYPQ
ncbi:Flavin reductase (NADPH) like protein [Argiope bruennichi]|uniref:Flavin reductase (NADPH) like protein n=1 Tax=Argiope bruennichi TaxID=94029 RepID=A0A8T0FT35_ARGBR|nr:Flavin reductase (NADPH) like protein [Argiope bruennichi]